MWQCANLLALLLANFGHQYIGHILEDIWACSLTQFTLFLTFLLSRNGRFQSPQTLFTSLTIFRRIHTILPPSNDWHSFPYRRKRGRRGEGQRIIRIRIRNKVSCTSLLWSSYIHEEKYHVSIPTWSGWQRKKSRGFLYHFKLQVFCVKLFGFLQLACADCYVHIDKPCKCRKVIILFHWEITLYYKKDKTTNFLVHSIFSQFFALRMES